MRFGLQAVALGGLYVGLGFGDARGHLGGGQIDEELSGLTDVSAVHVDLLDVAGHFGVEVDHEERLELAGEFGGARERLGDDGREVDGLWEGRCGEDGEK